MNKGLRFLSRGLLIVFFAALLAACGDSGGGSSDSGSEGGGTQPLIGGDLSQYSAGDIEDPNFNGVGIDEGVWISSSQNEINNLVEIQAVCDPEGIGYKNFCKNNCTEWVAKRRDEMGDAPVIWRGNGGEWLENAKAVGYETGNIPEVGAIAIFKLSYDPCPGEESCTNKALYKYGHVAYVKSVNGDDWCVSEYNYLNPLAYGERCFSVKNKPPTLIGFIYGIQTSPETDSDSPSMPTDLAVSAISSNHINLSWTASTDNVGVAGYKIYRNGFYLKSVPTYLTSDTGLSPATQYCYSVLAYDVARNESSLSSQICATTQIAGIVSLSTLRWPLDGDPTVGDVVSGFHFGDDWICDSCSSCGGLHKKHTGVDLKSNVGAPVYAAEAGRVETFDPGDPWGEALIILHNGFMTNYTHIKIKDTISDGQPVTKGQQIGTVFNLGSRSHLHFGIWVGSYSDKSHRGALPQINTTENYYCQNDPLFPENFIDPMTLIDEGSTFNTPPTATITSPSDGSTYTQGQSITFSGSGYDAEDGPLNSGFLVWTSSIDGQIGAGTSFPKSDLSLGTHTITLTATDSNGESGNASISVTVNPIGTITLTAIPECSNDNTPQIRISWTKLPDGVNYYEIYRDGSWYESVGSNVNSFADTDVTLGTTYSYFIQAKTIAGDIESNLETVTAACEVPPGIFTLTVTPWCDGNDPVNLIEWTGSSGRTFPYEVFRDGYLVFTTDFNRYDDTAVTAGTSYSYFVRAKNSVGYRDSNAVTVPAKNDCGAPVPPIIDTISPQSVTVGDGGFTLTIIGQNFDATAKILYDFSVPPYGVLYPTFVDSETLTLEVIQNSGGFSPFQSPGTYYIQVLKPGPNFWDGDRSNTLEFSVLNPVPVVSSITGTCEADFNCTPANGYDVRINGSGFVNNIAYTNGNYISSTYAQINGNETPVSIIGGGPVTNQLQLYVNGSLIPTPGTYIVTVCNAGTIGGTSCATGYLTVEP